MKFITQISSPNYKRSCQFYETAGYHSLLEDDNGRYIFDGKYISLISKNRKFRNGLIVFTDSEIEVSKSNSELYASEIAQDPNGMHVVFRDSSSYPSFHIDQLGNSTFGNPYGLGIESVHFKETCAFWMKFGFKIGFGEIEKGGFVSMNSNGFDLAIFKHGSCPHSFNNPSFSFFNGKEGNPKIIQRLKELNMEFSEEVTVFNERS